MVYPFCPGLKSTNESLGWRGACLGCGKHLKSRLVSTSQLLDANGRHIRMGVICSLRLWTVNKVYDLWLRSSVQVSWDFVQSLLDWKSRLLCATQDQGLVLWSWTANVDWSWTLQPRKPVGGIALETDGRMARWALLKAHAYQRFHLPGLTLVAVAGVESSAPSGGRQLRALLQGCQQTEVSSDGRLGGQILFWLENDLHYFVVWGEEALFISSQFQQKLWG